MSTPHPMQPVPSPKPGDTLRTSDGESLRLGAVLGLGGQGAVYALEDDLTRCVKVYFVPEGERAVELRQRFTVLKARGARLDTHTLVLPTATLAAPWAGYVMHRVCDAQPLEALAIAPRHERIDAWYARTGGLRHRLLLAERLVQAFRALHLAGLAYQDLSWANVLSPRQGPPAIHLIDCDNLTVDGVPPSGIAGTPWFIAPEVLSGEPATPLSDQHALSVLLYHLLVLTHPLLGDAIRAGDPADEDTALRGIWPAGATQGERLPWIDHPADRRNQTRAGLPRALVLSSGLSTLFHEAFSKGLRGPTRTARPTERAWLQALGNALDATVRCACGQTYYLVSACPWCGQPRQPVWLLFAHHRDTRRPITLEQRRRLYSRHLHGRVDLEATEPLAEVVATERGLRLEAKGRDLLVTRTSGGDSVVTAGDSAQLARGDRLRLSATVNEPLSLEVAHG